MSGLAQLEQELAGLQDDLNTCNEMLALDPNSADALEDGCKGDGEATGEGFLDDAKNNDVTGAFLRLSHLPSCPLDRLSRYEATLWRQACQTLFSLRFLQRRRPWRHAR